MDGVMQAPGGPTEDPTKGFKFGEWSMPYFDQAAGEEIDRLFKEKFVRVGILGWFAEQPAETPSDLHAQQSRGENQRSKQKQ